MYNVGILGCGKMGNIYARNFYRNERTEIKAFYNRTFQKAVGLATEYDAVAYDDWKKLVSDPAIDIVGICTPSSEHHELLLECIKNKKHVMIEKPLAATLAQAEEMTEAVLNSDVKVLVGFQMRFHPVIEKLNELLVNAGKIYNVDFYFGMYRPEVTWRHKKEQGGGVFKELGSHLVDLSCMWLGDHTCVGSVNRIFGAGREVEDFCQALIEFKNGSVAGISCNYWDRAGRSINGKIMAENLQLNFAFSSYDVTDSKVTLYDSTGVHDIELGLPPDDDIDETYPGHLNSFKKEIEYFIDSVANGRDISSSIKAGLESMIITDEVYRSIEGGV